MKQNVKFEWNDDHEQAFSVLKNELSSESLLAFYNPQEDIRLVTDASGHALGAVLLQKENDVYRPIYYVSRTLKPSELNYSVIEKEALALVWAVEKFHLYLFGKKFEVVVDHKPLKFIFQPQARLIPRIARWQIKLQAYSFDVIYEKGEKNIADFLSRNGAESTSSSVYVQESMITVEDANGNRITRNISFVKHVNKTGENKTETETEKKTERKQYPKRERKYV